MKEKSAGASVSARDIATAAVFTAAICVVAPFSFYIGPVPLSLATLVVYIAGGTLKPKLSVLSVFVYILIGATGAPVFSGFRGGFHILAGPTGGFLAGYLPCAAITGLSPQAFGAGVLKGRLSLALGMLIGTAALYTCGTAFFAVSTASPIAASVMVCVTPFLPGDALKIAAACLIIPKLRSSLGALDKSRVIR